MEQKPKFKKYTYEKQPIYVIADIHGHFEKLMSDIETIKNCLLIIAGDIGLGFQSQVETAKTLSKLNKKCITQNINILLLRGNHDNPKFFNNKDNQYSFSNIKTIPDYSIISVDKINILCIGGAISEDRVYRLNFMKNHDDDYECYWKNEKLKYDKNILNEIQNSKINIDYVVTHCGPKCACIKEFDTYKNWVDDDKSLEEEILKERSDLNEIFEFLLENGHKIKGWLFGHYHYENNMEYKGVKFYSLPQADLNFKYVELN